MSSAELKRQLRNHTLARLSSLPAFHRHFYATHRISYFQLLSILLVCKKLAKERLSVEKNSFHSIRSFLRTTSVC